MQHCDAALGSASCQLLYNTVKILYLTAACMTYEGVYQQLAFFLSGASPRSTPHHRLSSEFFI